MKTSNFETLDDMLEALDEVSQGGLVENIILLAKVTEEDDTERLFVGWSPDIFDDPTAAVGSLEFLKARIFELMSIRQQAH